MQLSENIIVKFQNVSKNFGIKEQLTNINFTLKQKEITTLIGPNGVGKTTIVKLILNLYKPNSGNIYIKKNITIGYVPQKLDFFLNMPITAKQFFNLLIKNKSQRIGVEEIEEFAKINHYKDHDISTLSRGQLQKLILAATLIVKNDLLILDEPIQSLDLTSQQLFYNLLTKLKEESNTNILMVSHDLFTVIKNSDQVICLNGHICCTGQPTEYNSKEEFSRIFLARGVYEHKHDHTH